MPRIHFNPLDGAVTPIPDGVPDDQAPAYAQSLRGQRQMGQGQGLAGLANIFSGVMGRYGSDGARAPVDGRTMPQGFPTAAGLGMEGTTRMLDMQQRSNMADVGARLQHRAEMERALEAEKDRAQQLKVEDARMKNEMKLTQMREKIAMERMKREAKFGQKFGEKTGQRPSPEQAKQMRELELRQEQLEAQSKQWEVDTLPSPEEVKAGRDADLRYKNALAERAARPSGTAAPTGGSSIADSPAAVQSNYVEALVPQKQRELAMASPQFQAARYAAAKKLAAKKYDNKPWWPGGGEPTEAQIQKEMENVDADAVLKSIIDDFEQDARVAVTEELYGIRGGVPQPQGQQAPYPGAQQAPDGNWYVKNEQGGWSRVQF